jgi:hypothetical protein
MRGKRQTYCTIQELYFIYGVFLTTKKKIPASCSFLVIFFFYKPKKKVQNVSLLINDRSITPIQ